jgi:hypothetical protein
MVSKKAIYNLIPQKYYPITELIKEGALKEIKTTIEKAFIQYLVFVKPILVWPAVKKINTVQELEQYAIKILTFWCKI